MSPDIRQLIQLQALDDAIASLSAEIDSLPRHIKEIETKLHAHQAQYKSDKDALAANQKRLRDLDGEIVDHNQKISRLKDQMLQAKTNEQYKAFQHEIEFHEKAIRDAEDVQLGLMEQSELLSQNVRVAEDALRKEEAAVNAEKAEAEKRVAELRETREADRTERKAGIEQLSTEVRRNYENMVSRGRRQVVAEVTGNTCGSCHMTIRLQVVQELALSDKLHRCDTCGAYLYVVPVTAVDEHGPA